MKHNQNKIKRNWINRINTKNKIKEAKTTINFYYKILTNGNEYFRCHTNNMIDNFLNIFCFVLKI